MSFQAQVRDWVQGELSAVLGPVFERLDKLEAYVEALEKSPEVPPAQDVTPRPSAAKTATGRPGATARPQTASGTGKAQGISGK